MQKNQIGFQKNADLIGKNGIHIRNQCPQIYKEHFFLFLNFLMSQNLLDSVITKLPTLLVINI